MFHHLAGRDRTDRKRFRGLSQSRAGYCYKIRQCTGEIKMQEIRARRAMLAGVLEVSVKCGRLPPDAGDLTGLLYFFFFFFLISLFTLVVTIRPQVAFHCTPANSCFSLQFISTSAKSQHNFNYIHTIYIIDYIK